ncbi:UDP-N-acetylenolpyruvoylglucosamine reductase [bacterium (Candidatus Gribaldobacteria) CG07_land_8_20_14_0_80_33_18]|uniref:UDP-N-acetylenolpyruvoylglucosamine reductase n=1 Tax=bacterium (Candidatus Gribaldobacteria) CG07_land_8_20_14_0_80_33_18 TaxID=2014272 RepID=A0A2M6Z424_9BACT|nr:MAG: UDP-N-acetylenolpyruvoylglucosamine reductase [bacterium (Candidatus Gribaldobacteria) CG10_big_fil_rev_8_21_14_0_10_33_41]PIU47130.1 MAG: UDP-N-acetylenolpyruvoylglucosamine reductase [bacterium (Candidatus Gribaldobacteria) CG07_land_8_20_14_0_80_33_18]PJA00835.1 MAG: UDP-N-acetylenolpyruvoylglucosamine reductase [bacterium (Candidatus Gribaldobacteria) CG_4_10_14_0_2_um_filter_33_15]PJB08653.1 MAG: UDP-N-acetylenolpyruvoylglucosamine reductase [bacterium (Candidatus Gribaldobacteria) 
MQSAKLKTKMQNDKSKFKINRKFKKNVLLRDYTTFKIGGPAKYFFEAKTEEDLIEAIKFVYQKKLPFFVLGGGSNILFSNEGFEGMIIRCQISNIKCQNSKIYTEAGVKLSDLVKLSSDKGLSGLEWVAGIPGTVGGAIWGNAGAFGKSIADIIKEVKIFNAKELRIKNYELRDCKFGYRESIFKKNKNLIILSCLLELKKGKRKEIRKKIKKNIDYRIKNHPLNFSSAGCVFKNYESRIRNQGLMKKFSELKEFNKKREIPAAWLIEKCGLKGRKIGGAQVSEKHANFIVNLRKASSNDIIKLINLVKKKVKEKFDIKLEKEIQII